MLLERGADVNAIEQHDGRSPLHWAAGRFRRQIPPEVIVRLLEGGANVNAPDAAGNTPLHLAARNAGVWYKPEPAVTIKLLLANGADSGATNSEGQMPCAMVQVDDDSVRALLCP